MSLKVKTFQDSTLHRLGQQLNEFLDDGRLNIITIHPTYHVVGLGFMATIVYREGVE